MSYNTGDPIFLYIVVYVDINTVNGTIYKYKALHFLLYKYNVIFISLICNKLFLSRSQSDYFFGSQPEIYMIKKHRYLLYYDTSI